MKTNPREPIFFGKIQLTDEDSVTCLGLTKREYMATQILQGLVAGNVHGHLPDVYLSKMAVEYTDTLINTLNDETKKAPETVNSSAKQYHDMCVKISKVLVETAGLAPLKEGCCFAENLNGEDLNLDSLDHVECIMALEEEFDIEIPDEDAEKCSTVGGIYRLIDRLLKTKERQSQR